MAFTTKLDYSDNRQIKQRVGTHTDLSGGTSFGVSFSNLPFGPDLSTSGVTETYNLIASTFSGNNIETIYTWYDSRMELAISTLSAITPSTSATTQIAGPSFEPSAYIIVDGNSIPIAYTGVTFDVSVITMTDLGGGTYSGTVETEVLLILSAGTDNYTGRTIWVDVSGKTRTEELIITKAPNIGDVFTCIDSEGLGAWQPNSGGTGGNAYWSAGTGANAIVTLNSTNIASGDFAVAEGDNTTASGLYAHAEGQNTIASGWRSHAEGSGTEAYGDYSHAEGSGTRAFDYSHAEGYDSEANGPHSHAQGYSTEALGDSSHAGGAFSIAQGDFSFVHGSGSTAVGNFTNVFGRGITGNNADTTYVDYLNIKRLFAGTSVNNLGIDASGNVVIGSAGGSGGTGTTYWSAGTGSNAIVTLNSTNIASNTYALAEGKGTIASGQASHAEGSGTTAGGDGSHAEGWATFALGELSHAEGYVARAYGFVSHAQGLLTSAMTEACHAEGAHTFASGNAAHAEGFTTRATNNFAHAEGYYSQAMGIASHAGGYETIASGSYSFAGGSGGTASGTGSFSIGYNTLASGIYSHAEGMSTIASGQASHAEGIQTIAGFRAHAEGDQSQALGGASHAEGHQTSALGDASHAEGEFTQAIGNYSHTEGQSTIASGQASHAQGFGTTAYGNQSHAGGSATQAYGLNSFVHGADSQVNGNYSIVLGRAITGNTADTTYVDGLNIKTVPAGPGTIDIGVDANGRVVNQASDIRLKENINTIENALETVLKLRGVTYNWKDRESGGDDLKMGLIAQEVLEVVPELVTNNGEYLGVQYKDIPALLIEAIKELVEVKTEYSKKILETQTILAEDNNIDLNVNGNEETALGGGIKVLRGNSSSTDLIIDSDGNWVSNVNILSKGFVIPDYTPTSSSDEAGIEGNITRDDDYLYIKTKTGWKRTGNLENF